MPSEWCYIERGNHDHGSDRWANRTLVAQTCGSLCNITKSAAQVLAYAFRRCSDAEAHAAEQVVSWYVVSELEHEHGSKNNSRSIHPWLGQKGSWMILKLRANTHPCTCFCAKIPQSQTGHMIGLAYYVVDSKHEHPRMDIHSSRGL